MENTLSVISDSEEKHQQIIVYDMKGEWLGLRVSTVKEKTGSEKEQISYNLNEPYVAGMMKDPNDEKSTILLLNMDGLVQDVI